MLRISQKVTLEKEIKQEDARSRWSAKSKPQEGYSTGSRGLQDYPADILVLPSPLISCGGQRNRSGSR